jgi:hypothetical protein
LSLLLHDAAFGSRSNVIDDSIKTPGLSGELDLQADSSLLTLLSSLLAEIPLPGLAAPECYMPVPLPVAAANWSPAAVKNVAVLEGS